MNIILLRLVEYLGHTNPLVCGVAYDEVSKLLIRERYLTNSPQIQKISKYSSYLVMRLFMPYWRTIAPTVVKDLQRRPQIAQYLSDLLAMSVSEFLCLTQVYTIPYLVLTKKRDVLQRIADSSGRTVKALCMDHNNLAATLAFIFLHSSDDMETFIMASFNAVSSEFSNIDCQELVRAEPVITASELLKAASEENNFKKTKVSQILDFVVRQD